MSRPQCHPPDARPPGDALSVRRVWQTSVCVPSPVTTTPEGRRGSVRLGTSRLRTGCFSGGAAQPIGMVFQRPTPLPDDEHLRHVILRLPSTVSATSVFSGNGHSSASHAALWTRQGSPQPTRAALSGGQHNALHRRAPRHRARGAPHGEPCSALDPVLRQRSRPHQTPLRCSDDRPVTHTCSGRPCFRTTSRSSSSATDLSGKCLRWAPRTGVRHARDAGRRPTSPGTSVDRTLRRPAAPDARSQRRLNWPGKARSSRSSRVRATTELGQGPTEITSAPALA